MPMSPGLSILGVKGIFVVYKGVPVLLLLVYCGFNGGGNGGQSKNNSQISNMTAHFANKMSKHT